MYVGQLQVGQKLNLKFEKTGSVINLQARKSQKRKKAHQQSQ